METFEPGVQSAYNTHQFREGEEGMKCLRSGCPRVMTMAEWEEKRRCFCQSSNAVRAIARSAPPTRIPVSPNRPLHPPVDRPTRRTPVPITPITIPPSPPQHGWRWAGIAALLLCIGGLTAPFVQSLRIQQSQNYQNTIIAPQLTPKEVITRYYQLAPSNRTAALAFLSEDYKNYYKQSQNNSNAKSFWSYINGVDIYSFQTLSSPSEERHKIKVWLRYLTSDNITSCETVVIELVFERNQGLWLIDKTSDVQQKPYCSL